MPPHSTTAPGAWGSRSGLRHLIRMGRARFFVLLSKTPRSFRDLSVARLWLSKITLTIMFLGCPQIRSPKSGSLLVGEIRKPALNTKRRRGWLGAKLLRRLRCPVGVGETRGSFFWLVEFEEDPCQKQITARLWATAVPFTRQNQKHTMRGLPFQDTPAWWMSCEQVFNRSKHLVRF